MNISRTILLCCLVFWMAKPASAQGFLQTYLPDSSVARAVVQTPDGGFFMAGQVANPEFLDKKLFLLRTDSTGETLWTNHFYLNEARAIATCAAPDGGFVVLAENYWDTIEYRNIILKINDLGVLQWSRVVPNLLPSGSSIANGLADIVALSDGHFMAAGNSRNNDFQTQTWLIKIAPDGSIVWDKTVGSGGRIITSLVELPTGNVVVAGHLADFSLAKVNPEGNLLWEHDYPMPGNQVVYDLLATTEGNIALLGTSPEQGNLSISILKTDLDGTPLWHNNYYPFPAQSNYLPVLNCFAQDGAGNFYVPYWGFEDDPLASDLQLLSIAANGVATVNRPLHVSGNAWAIIRTSDNHLAIAGDNNGLPATQAILLKTDFAGESLSNKITGNVFRDDNVDCALSAGESGMADFIVKAQKTSGEQFFRKTNPDGSYEILVPSGDFELSVRPSFAPNGLYEACDTPSVSVYGTAQTVAAPAVAVQVLGECPLLSVEIAGGLLRRCTTVVYNAHWCNAGNQTATDAWLELTVAPHLEYLSSSLPLASQSGDTLRFDLGDVAPNDCGEMNLVFHVSCNANQGDVLCVEAHVFPDTSCISTNAQWDGSKIEVTGECTGSEIEFTIKNTGTGNMTQNAEYVIIEDQIMYMQAPLQLNANQSMTTVRVPMPEDSCFALQVFPNQTSILSKPVAVVANCTANGNLNLLLSLPNNENDEALAVHCDAIIGSFDPNDKTGFPLGLTDAHYLERGQDIEYRIRFQNTGNDTAFLVTILDALPATLDPATIRPMAASHAYTWDVTDQGLLRFTFAQILLPDSTTNEPASHGFVSFRISQRPNLPDGTRIDNTVAIVFDFNEAVQTNTWRHTIGRPETVSAHTPPKSAQSLAVQVLPNPLSEQAVFVLNDFVGKNTLRIALFDALGNIVRQEVFSGNTWIFDARNLPSGVYFWQISEERNPLAKGRVVVKKPCVASFACVAASRPVRFFQTLQVSKPQRPAREGLRPETALPNFIFKFYHS